MTVQAVSDREKSQEMEALVFSQFGTPEDVLACKKIPMPEPKAGEVRIRTILAPIHNHHLWYIRGSYGIKPKLPAVSGDEALGIVDAVGPGVKGLYVGEKVSACKMWGTWAEYFIAESENVVPVPQGIPDEIAAQLLSMPLSARMLVGVTGAKAGEWVIQNAANGAVGKAFVPLAASRQIHVVSLVRSGEAKEEMRQAGIQNIVSTADKDWQEQVLDLTGGHKAVAAIDSIGGEMSGQMFSLLKEGGNLIVFGSMSQQAVMIHPRDLIFYNKKIKGFWATRAAKEMTWQIKLKIFVNLLKAILNGRLNIAQAGGLNLERLSKALALKQLAAMVQAGKISLPVAGVYPLSEFKQALSVANKQGKNGKVIFRP